MPDDAGQQLTTKPQSRSESPGKPSVANWLYAVHCADSKSLSDGSVTKAVLDAPKIRSCKVTGGLVAVYNILELLVLVYHTISQETHPPRGPLPKQTAQRQRSQLLIQCMSNRGALQLQP